MTSTSDSHIIFRGIDGNECEEFISAIEELAFAEGWSRDRERMLLFARSRLKHRALRWFAKLEPSKKEDWDCFVEALFDEYPVVGDTSGEITGANSRTGSSQSSSVFANKLPETAVNSLDSPFTRRNEAEAPSLGGRQIGLLRVVADSGTSLALYVSQGPTTGHSQSYITLPITPRRQEALVVCFISAPEPHSIGCLIPALSNALAVYYSHRCRAYILNLIPQVSAFPDCSTACYVSTVWNVLPDGTLQTALREYKPDTYGRHTLKTDFKSTQVLLDTGGKWVGFVKPNTILRQDDSALNNQPGLDEYKARIVFEPL